MVGSTNTKLLWMVVKEREIITVNFLMYVPTYISKCGAGEGWRRSVGPIM
jgi:hypothetical protein